MFDLFKIIVGVLLSVWLGAWYARQWQLQNWLEQQRINDVEKEYIEHKTLFDDFVGVASKRYVRARRLLWAISRNNIELITVRLEEYDASVVAWNDMYCHILQAKLVRI